MVRARIALLSVLCVSGGVAVAGAPHVDPVTVHVFYENAIHFAPDDSSRYDTEVVKASDKGREITRTLEIVRPSSPVRITALLTVLPIPKDEVVVHDKWDRAGNVRLCRPGMPDIEVVKFVTAYGGKTSYEVDVTHLDSLLDGPCTFRGFIDTWVSPAWKISFSLLFEPVAESNAPDWVAGILYDQSFTEERLREGERAVDVWIPEEMGRVEMHYLVSGHCTDGTGADEFVSKDNVITVDGVEVYRFQPWRDDCLQFRTINPYCRRWSDGSWSSDYSRSGWCPGDEVPPVRIDLTPHLPPGEHVIGFRIEDIRPKNEEGNLGYWRVSSHLLGWAR
jgi:hypothetical protein